MSQHHPPKLYADGIPLDLSAFGRAIENMIRSIRKAFLPAVGRALASVRKISATIEPMIRQAEAVGVTREELLADPAKAAWTIEVKISGWENRYRLRAAYDPAYRSPAALDVLVRRTLEGRPEFPEEPLSDFTRHNRARLAAAAIRGWVEKEHAA